MKRKRRKPFRAYRYSWSSKEYLYRALMATISYTIWVSDSSYFYSRCSLVRISLTSYAESFL